MISFYIFLFHLLLLRGCVSDSMWNLNVNRAVRDGYEVKGMTGCKEYSSNTTQVPPHSQNTVQHCTCDTDHTTIMSEGGHPYFCGSSEDLSCIYSLDSEAPEGETFLLNEGNVTKTILPQMEEANISSIFMWNLLDTKIGKWVDVSEEARRIISVRTTPGDEGDSIHVSDFESSIWEGHLIRVVFQPGNDNCLLLKFNGRNSYPVSMSAFREQFWRSSSCRDRIPHTILTMAFSLSILVSFIFP